MTLAIGPLSIALFFGCTDDGDRLDASLLDAGRGGKGGSQAGVGGAVAGRGHGGDADDAGAGGDGASSASGGSDNGEGGSRPSKGGSQGVGGAGGKGARGGSGGAGEAGESGQGASGGVAPSGGAGAGGVSTGAGGARAGSSGASGGGIGPGGDAGDGGTGGETELPEQLDLCIRLTDTTDLAFQMSLRYESTVNHDCRVNWVAGLYYDSTIGFNERADFLNQLLHFNLRLWGCPGSAAPTRFDLIYTPTSLSEADAATLIDAYVDRASLLLTLSGEEETAMRELLERLSTKVLVEPDPGGYTQDRCAGGAGAGGAGAGGAGAGGAGAGGAGAGGEGGAEPGGAAGQAGAG